MSLSPREQALLQALQDVTTQLDRIEQRQSTLEQTLKADRVHMSQATELQLKAIEMHKDAHDSQVRSLNETAEHVDKAWKVHLSELHTRTHKAETQSQAVTHKIERLDQATRRLESALRWLSIKVGLGLWAVVVLSVGIMWWMRPPDVTSQVVEDAERGRRYGELLNRLTQDERNLILDRMYMPKTTRPLQATPLPDETSLNPSKKKKTSR